MTEPVKESNYRPHESSHERDITRPTRFHPHFHCATWLSQEALRTPHPLALPLRRQWPRGRLQHHWSNLDLIRQQRSLTLCERVHTQTLSHCRRVFKREGWVRGEGDSRASLWRSEGFGDVIIPAHWHFPHEPTVQIKNHRYMLTIENRGKA